MSTYETQQQESSGTDYEQLDDRTERALTEYMTVLPQGGEVYTVVGENGSTYRVDGREGRCTCPDHEHRAVECKHIRRVAFATGAVPIPGEVDGVDALLGEHANDERQVAATDGGQVVEPAGERVRVPVDGGVLIYERREVGKELVGFEDVTNWDELGEAVVARGHSRGDVLHLPELDE
jgi:hypothetical protein